MNPCPGPLKFLLRAVPAGDLAEKLRCFAIKVREAFTQEFADHKGVQHGSKILRCSNQSASATIGAKAVHFSGEVGLIGAGAVVARPARTYRQAKAMVFKLRGSS